MTIRLAMVMDPIASLNVAKDSSFAILRAAAARDYQLFVTTQQGLSVHNGTVSAVLQEIHVFDQLTKPYEIVAEQRWDLRAMDLVMLRKDPPFDIEYVYTTQMLSLVANQGVLVVNDPDSLRAYNEKLMAQWFPDITPPSLVSRSKAALLAFAREYGDVVLKPLAAMGGYGVFVARRTDTNLPAMIELLTHQQSCFIMMQQYLPASQQGDKRIILIDGEPIPYGLLRIPPAGDARANLAVGASAKGCTLTARDRWICEQLGPWLRQQGLVFAGIDVIGDWLTEINITSPTCIRELDALYNLDIAKKLLQSIETMLM